MTNDQILATLDDWLARRQKVLEFRRLMNIADRPAGRQRRRELIRRRKCLGTMT